MTAVPFRVKALGPVALCDRVARALIKQTV
jgi:hypothetical protein